MSDVDLSEFYPVKDIRCVVGKFLDALTEGERAQLTAALAHQDISNPSIAAWLARRGYKTTGTTIGTHRKGQCRCD